MNYVGGRSSQERDGFVTRVHPSRQTYVQTSLLYPCIPTLRSLARGWSRKYPEGWSSRLQDFPMMLISSTPRLKMFRELMPQA